MSDDDEEPNHVRPTLSQIHVTDVVASWSRHGHRFFSVVAVGPYKILVQDQDGAQFWAFPSQFVARYSLRASAGFAIQWRVSPIQAAAAHKAGAPQE